MNSAARFSSFKVSIKCHRTKVFQNNFEFIYQCQNGTSTDILLLQSFCIVVGIPVECFCTLKLDELKASLIFICLFVK